MTMWMGHLEGLSILSTSTNGVVPLETNQLAFVIVTPESISHGKLINMNHLLFEDGDTGKGPQ